MSHWGCSSISLASWTSSYYAQNTLISHYLTTYSPHKSVIHSMAVPLFLAFGRILDRSRFEGKQCIYKYRVSGELWIVIDSLVLTLNRWRNRAQWPQSCFSYHKHMSTNIHVSPASGWKQFGLKTSTNNMSSKEYWKSYIGIIWAMNRMRNFAFPF